MPKYYRNNPLIIVENNTSKQKNLVYKLADLLQKAFIYLLRRQICSDLN